MRERDGAGKGSCSLNLGWCRTVISSSGFKVERQRTLLEKLGDETLGTGMRRALTAGFALVPSPESAATPFLCSAGG